jgi:Bacterial Ig domain
VATLRDAPPPPPPGASVKITSPANGATVRGSVPIRIETSGLATGTKSYEIFLNSTRRWFWRTTATSITQWFTTTAVPNGAYTIRVKVTDSAGKVVETSISVTLRN